MKKKLFSYDEEEKTSQQTDIEKAKPEITLFRDY